MTLTLAGTCDTGLRGLYRLAGDQPAGPIYLSLHARGDVWAFDWTAQRLQRLYRPRRTPLQRLHDHLRRRPIADGSQERPLHEVRSLILQPEGLLAVDDEPATQRTCLIDLHAVKASLLSSGLPAYTAACVAAPSSGSPAARAALGGHRSITLTRWPDGGVLGVLAGHNDGARDMAFSPDGRLLVSIGGESEDEQHRDAVRLWDVATLHEQQSWLWHHLGAVAFHPAGNVIAVGCMMPSAVKLWHLDSGGVETVAVDAPGGIAALCFSAGGRWLWAGDRNGRLLLFAVRM